MQAIKPNQLSIANRAILVVMLIALVVLVQSCGVHNKRGAATPDRLVEQYSIGLETKNEKLIIQLTPETADFTSQAKTKIRKFGGRKLQDRQVIYTKLTPFLWNASIRGIYLDRDGTKQKVEDSIELKYLSKGELKLYAGRWYLFL
ncbi:hypothetical protein [Chamaesiphon sp. VAR_69_metabat_338]|uniref:hypothetical protein n=1 Tax=Chamaesiphon sp. VAR_69_metabat_338 TaxID=2964704 RepID=UPI00286E101F|nr:hypothetical protein [Chamaesiphon sp. VAR_69_metabat_338]